MLDEPLVCFFWRFADTVDYWIFQLRLCILDAICGPEPPIAADLEREGIATECRGFRGCLGRTSDIERRQDCSVHRRPCRRQVPFPYT
jgi:hypothetical protein